MKLELDGEELQSDIWRDTFKPEAMVEIESMKDRTYKEGIMKNDETNKQEKKSAVALVTDDSSTTMKLLFNKVSSFSQILNCYGNSSK